MLIPEHTVFIGGPHRSGTGMLRAIVGSNSRIAIPPKEYRFFDLLGPRASLPPVDPPALLREVMTWPKVREWGLSVEEACSFLSPGFMTSEVTSEMTAEMTAEDGALKAVYAAPLLAYAGRLGKPGFGDKTPGLEAHFPILLDWFGAATRLIHIIRDPFDTFLSMTAYSGFAGCPGPAEFAHRWRSGLLRGLQFSHAYPENYLFLKYEDFVADPVRWTETICDFAGIPREVDRMLSMADFGRKENSSFGPEHRAGRAFEVYRPVAAARPALPPEDASMIQTGVFPHASLIGYPEPVFAQQSDKA